MNTSLLIARKREENLHELLGIIQDGIYKEKDPGRLIRDNEMLIEDCLDLVKFLHEVDENHNLRVAEDSDYPFEENQEVIERAFEEALNIVTDQIRICDTITKATGYSFKRYEELVQCENDLKAMLNPDDSYIESRFFKELTERALRDYEAGRLEEWPR